jgi:PhnB protein
MRGGRDQPTGATLGCLEAGDYLQRSTTMSSVSVYLYFVDQTEAAFAFYKDVFGTDYLMEPARYGTLMGGEAAQEMPEEIRNLIANVQLPILGGHVLMGSDSPPMFGTTMVVGNNVQICLRPGSRDEADVLCAALSNGGTVDRPLEDQVWGDYYGELTDPFGVKWIIAQTPTA